MKKILLITMIVLGWLSLPQDVQGQAVIRGHVDSTLGIDSIEIRYAFTEARTATIFSMGLPKTITVEDGCFHLNFPEAPPHFYVLFFPPHTVGDRGKSIFRSIMTRPLMLRKNDTIELEITPQEVLITNNDNLSFKSQMELSKLMPAFAQDRVDARRRYDFIDSTGLEERVMRYMDEYRSIHNEYIEKGRQLMENKYSSLPKGIREVILYDYIGRLRFSEINGLSFSVQRGRVAMRPFIAAYYRQHYLGELDSATLAAYPGSSILYARLLNYKVVIDLIMSLELVKKDVVVELLPVLEILAQRYQGELYDQVAFAAYLDRGSRTFVDDQTYSLLLSTIKNPVYRDYIIQKMNRMRGGSPFYVFELRDDEGNTIRNRDLAGKVVVYDFWFSGCGGCIALHKHMQPIREHFKDNPNVVFASVCIDKKEEMWKRSLQSGNYTESSDTKLWVGEEGDLHPMIRFYSINSYPTVFLVDGKNQIVAMNPPDPRRDHGKDALIRMMEQALAR